MTKEITTSNINSILKDNRIVVMDFWADWCGPCRMLNPIIEKVSKQNKDIVVGKVDIDEHSELAGEYNVRSIPMLLFMKEGKVVSKNTGVMSDIKIQEIINSMKG